MRMRLLWRGPWKAAEKSAEFPALLKQFMVSIGPSLPSRSGCYFSQTCRANRMNKNAPSKKTKAISKAALTAVMIMLHVSRRLNGWTGLCSLLACGRNEADGAYQGMPSTFIFAIGVESSKSSSTRFFFFQIKRIPYFAVSLFSTPGLLLYRWQTTKWSGSISLATGGTILH